MAAITAAHPCLMPCSGRPLRPAGACPSGVVAMIPRSRLCRPQRHVLLLLAPATSIPAPDSSSSSSNGASQRETDGAGGEVAAPAAAYELEQEASTGSICGSLWGWFKAQQERSTELRKRLTELGLAAVLSYGLFDGVSYTIAFSLAFLGYEAHTGLNPTQNVANIVKICILMWAGNNVTRPFRLVGAAALAPFMDKLMVRMQTKLRLKNKVAAFAILVAAVATVCCSILGGLFFSRWVRG